MDSRWPAGDTAVDDELEPVGAALRAALVRPVDPALTEEHVRLMVAAHRPARLSRLRRRPAPRLRAAHRPWWPSIVTAVAAAVVAAAVTGSFPRPVQDRLASAAAAVVGIHLPRHHPQPTRVSTPVPPTTVAPPTPSTPETTVPPTDPSTRAAVAPTPPAPSPSPPSGSPPSTVLGAPTPLGAPPPGPLGAPPAPPHSAPAPAPTTVAAPAPSTPRPPSSTTTTRSPTGCVDPVLVSMTATLVSGGQVVEVVLHTTGTVPYVSVDITGATGVSANLQPTADGFQGTVTAASPITAGMVAVAGSCGGQIRGSAVIQP
jgi:hypothetical protein